MQEFKSLILGTPTVWYYLAALAFSFLGILLSLLLQSRDRDKDSPATPVHYSFRFLLWDNTKRILAGLIIMFAFFRFTDEIVHHPLTMWLAFLLGVALGFGFDILLLQWLKNKKKFMQMNREKIMDVLNQKQVS